MELTPEQQALTDEYVGLIGDVTNLAWGYVESSRDTSELVELVDRYVDVSDRLADMLASASEDDVDDPSSASSRLIWATAGDSLVLQMLGAVDLASQSEVTALQRLTALADDDLMPSEAQEAVRRGEVQYALNTVASAAHRELLPEVIAGVQGGREIAGASGGEDLATVAIGAVDEITGEAASTVGELFIGEIAAVVPVATPHHLISGALTYVSSGMGRAVTRCFRAIQKKLVELASLENLEGCAEWVFSHCPPAEKISRSGLHELLGRKRLEGEIRRLAGKVPMGRESVVEADLHNVSRHFHRWNRAARWTAKGLRWAGPVAVPLAPIGPAVASSVFVAAVAYVGFITWDHLDWPQLPVNGRSRGIIGVLN